MVYVGIILPAKPTLPILLNIIVFRISVTNIINIVNKEIIFHNHYLTIYLYGIMTCPFRKSPISSLWKTIKNRFYKFFSSLFHKDDSTGIGSIVRMTAANLQAILDTSVDSIITINDECSIKAVNKTAEHMFGHRKEEIIGQNVKILMPEPYYSEHDSYVLNYLRTGVKKIIGKGREVVAKRKDGSTFPIDLAVSEVIVDNQRLFTGIVRDVSQRKEAEAIKMENLRIEAEMKAKNAFITMISHELRTPLHAIMGFTECLINEIDGPLNEMQRISLQHSYQASQHLLQLVNGVLELSKIASLQVTTMTEKCNLVSIFDICLEIMKPLAIQKNIQLMTNISSSQVFIKANPQHIQQILLNLLSNAIKFTDSGKIVVSIYDNSKNVIIRVEDTGIGIEPHDLPRIFIPFARSSFADIKSTSAYPGLGLGLAITKQLVEFYKGSIDVTSTREKGTTFTIQFLNFDSERVINNA